MDKYNNDLTVAVEHGELMHKTGLEYGRVNAFNEIVSMIISGDFKTGADVAQALIDIQKEEAEAEANE